MHVLIYIHIYTSICKYGYVYIYIFTFIYIYTYTSPFIYIYIYMYIYVCVSTYGCFPCSYTCFHVYTHRYIYVCIYVYPYVSMNMFAYTYLRVYAHIHLYIYIYVMLRAHSATDFWRPKASSFRERRAHPAHSSPFGEIRAHSVENRVHSGSYSALNGLEKFNFHLAKLLSPFGEPSPLGKNILKHQWFFTHA